MCPPLYHTAISLSSKQRERESILMVKKIKICFKNPHDLDLPPWVRKFHFWKITARSCLSAKRVCDVCVREEWNMYGLLIKIVDLYQLFIEICEPTEVYLFVSLFICEHNYRTTHDFGIRASCQSSPDRMKIDMRLLYQNHKSPSTFVVNLTTRSLSASLYVCVCANTITPNRIRPHVWNLVYSHYTNIVDLYQILDQICL